MATIVSKFNAPKPNGCGQNARATVARASCPQPKERGLSKQIGGIELARSVVRIEVVWGVLVIHPGRLRFALDDGITALPAMEIPLLTEPTR